jgi:hypothetical protein
MSKQPWREPVQLDLPFESFARYTAPETYADAYETGLNWNVSWWPGGPFVHHKNGKPDPISQAKYDAYHEGFKAGLEERLRVNQHFAEWWNTRKYRGSAFMKDAAYTPPTESNAHV